MWLQVLPQSFVQPLHAVPRQRVVFLGLEEALHVRQQNITGRKETSTQPEQLPAFLLTVPATAQAYVSLILKKISAFSECYNSPSFIQSVRGTRVTLKEKDWCNYVWLHTWCGCQWAAWLSENRSHPSVVQLSGLLQRSGPLAHSLSGFFWMGSHPCTSWWVGQQSRNIINRIVLKQVHKNQ